MSLEADRQLLRREGGRDEEDGTKSLSAIDQTEKVLTGDFEGMNEEKILLLNRFAKWSIWHPTSKKTTSTREKLCPKVVMATLRAWALFVLPDMVWRRG
jgi:hypothetical protein